MEQDLALLLAARREQEENAAEEGRISNADKRFALVERRTLFAVKLAVTLIALIALLFFALTDSSPAAIFLSGGGTISGMISLLFGRGPKDGAPH